MTRREVTLIRTWVEVGRVRRGRPGYAWVIGYYVVDPDSGYRIYPPVLRREAYILARDLGGLKCKVNVKDASEMEQQ